jgi:predicted ester cyclase
MHFLSSFAQGGNPMSVEENKRVARRMTEEPWNQGNVDALDEICDPAYRLNDSDGIAELKQAIREFRSGFPDIKMTIEELIAEGDAVVSRWSVRGTHLGEYQGVAATGKEVRGSGITIFHFRKGKIIEDRFESSTPDLRQTLLDA